MVNYTFNQTIIDNVSDFAIRLNQVSDLEIIGKYCYNYISVLPYASLFTVFTLTIISIILYNYEQPNFIGFVQMTAFVTILLGIINFLLLVLALKGGL